VSHPTNTLPEPEPPISSDRQSVSLSLSHAISLCAAGLLVCFFLPWVNLLLVKPSGRDLASEGGKLLLLWSIPIFSAITILAGIAKQSQKTVAQLTGALPFIFLGLGLYDEGKDLMQGLELGAYISLGLGLVLFILPRRLK
jgi:hypothetical protein